MEEHFRNLVFFIDRYVNDVHIAEDIAIDAFTDLVVNRRRYNFKFSLKTYLYMLGRSRAIDYLRRRRRIAHDSLDTVLRTADGGVCPDDVLLDKDSRRAVVEAVDGLPQSMREAVYLVYFDEMTYEEAARVMKKTKKQVDNLLYRAKGMLREVLGGVV